MCFSIVFPICACVWSFHCLSMRSLSFRCLSVFELVAFLWSVCVYFVTLLLSIHRMCVRYLLVFDMSIRFFRSLCARPLFFRWLCAYFHFAVCVCARVCSLSFRSLCVGCRYIICVSVCPSHSFFAQTNWTSGQIRCLERGISLLYYRKMIREGCAYAWGLY